MVADTTHLYWASWSAVTSYDFTTKNMRSVEAPALAFGIGLSDTRVFWTAIGAGDDGTRVKDGSVWSLCKW
jgi:hypothetical protein